ncbi:hypothetical protein M9H77_03847 [Catharanthus roseus]|uniref:Uncharacterized protein n=1 Tax=Catharanthus roseus TaxID=4058 RepID=A0ACC0CCV4_CATRO|nr:hypothetical protein M9H77_03847 [Catharanthus roseus]
MESGPPGGQSVEKIEDSASIRIMDIMGDIRKDGGRGPEKHIGGSISFSESLTKKQAILFKRFSKSKELKEQHKHRSGGEAGRVRRFYFRTILEISRGEEEGRGGGCGDRHTCADNLADMAIVVGGVSLMVETAISSVSDAFNEYMRRFTKQNHLVYIPPLPMLDLVRAAMGTDTLTSSPPTPAVDSKGPCPDVPVQSSSSPCPSIHAPSTDNAPSPSSDPRTDQDA